MSLLTLVRHGQASYMSENYDRLSPLGERQARRLGEFWAERGLTWTGVFHGPAQRHIRTMELVGCAYRDAGLPWPEPVPVPDVDEFDAFNMMRVMLPVLTVRHEHVRVLHQQFQAAQQTPDAGRRLEVLFEEVARLWSTGEFESPSDLETWAQFRARISRSIAHMRTLCTRASNYVVFTSGGPIAATVGLALDLKPDRAIELVWASRNCSYSEFLFTTDRFSLSAFNSFPHLGDPDLLTYR
jgi:broad specificity phosphatase PhoE